MANTKSKSKNTKTKSTKSKEQKNIEKAIKKMHPITLAVGLIFLAVGILVGYLTSYFISKDDTFELIGDSSIVVEVGDAGVYTDEGVKCISYGRDLSKNVVVNTNMTKNDDGTYTFDTSAEGEFYIIYTVDDVRVITVGGTNE